MTQSTSVLNQTKQLEQSDIHDILRNDRRRRIIEILRDTGDTVTVSELSEQIASVETGETPPPRDVRKSVYVSLHQTHLPKLDDWGVINYDYRSKELTLLERAQEVEIYMEVVPADDIPWGMYYLGLGVLSLVTLTATRFDLAFLATLGVERWAWFYLLLFTVSATYQTISSNERKLQL